MVRRPRPADPPSRDAPRLGPETGRAEGPTNDERRAPWGRGAQQPFGQARLVEDLAGGAALAGLAAVAAGAVTGAETEEDAKQEGHVWGVRVEWTIL